MVCIPWPVVGAFGDEPRLWLVMAAKESQLSAAERLNIARSKVIRRQMAAIKSRQQQQRQKQRLFMTVPMQCRIPRIHT